VFVPLSALPDEVDSCQNLASLIIRRAPRHDSARSIVRLVQVAPQSHKKLRHKSVPSFLDIIGSIRHKHIIAVCQFGRAPDRRERRRNETCVQFRNDSVEKFGVFRCPT